MAAGLEARRDLHGRVDHLEIGAGNVGLLQDRALDRRGLQRRLLRLRRGRAEQNEKCDCRNCFEHCFLPGEGIIGRCRTGSIDRRFLLFRDDARRLDHRRPFGDFAGQPGGEFRGRTQRQRHALRGDGFGRGIRRQPGGHRAVKPFDRRSRRLAPARTARTRRRPRRPGTPASASVGRFGRRAARLALATASAPTRRRRRYGLMTLGNVAKVRSTSAGKKLGGHRRRAAERDVLQVHAGPGLEQLRREVRRRADAGRGVVQLAGRFLGELHQCADVLALRVRAAPPAHAECRRCRPRRRNPSRRRRGSSSTGSGWWRGSGWCRG